MIARFERTAQPPKTVPGRAGAIDGMWPNRYLFRATFRALAGVSTGMSEQTGFADYVAARRERWVRAACLLTGDPHTAEDLVQSALLRVWPRWARICAQGDPDAYVRTVLMNLFLSSLRKRRWQMSTADPQAYERQDGRGDAARDAVDSMLYIRHMLADLAPRQRAVLVLRYYLDLSEAETASTLGCSVGTVKSQAAKGTAKLRARLDPTPASTTIRELS